MLARTAAAALLLISTGAVAALPDDYTVIEIFPGYTSPSSALAVSNTGTVVGCYGSAPATAYMWSSGQRTDLWSGCATAVNDNGVIGGYDASGNAVIWNNGTLTTLVQGQVNGINNAGHAVISYARFVNNVYTQSDYLYHDGQLDTMPTGCSKAINNLEQVLCDTTNGGSIWQGGTITPLPPPPPDAYSDSTMFQSPRGLTDRTQVAGNNRGFIYYSDGVTRRAMVMSDGALIGLNSSLVMLGDEEGIYGFVTDPTGTIKYFANMPGPSVWHKMGPRAINEAGWIVGNATTGPSTSGESFLMIPKAAAAPATPGQPVAGLPVMKRARMDVNGDGRGDAVLRSSNGDFGMWFMNGATINDAHMIAAPNNGKLLFRTSLSSPAFGDLIWEHPDGGYSVMMGGFSSQPFTKLLDGGTGWKIIGAGDFDGDGKKDLLWWHPTQGFGIWLMNGASVKSYGPLTTFPNNSWPAAIGDFNNDGRDEIAWIGDDGHVEMWTMNGMTGTPAGTLRDAGSGFVPAFIADFNADSRDDIVWTHPDGRTSLWLMDGASTIDSTSILAAGSGWHVVGTPDFNGDGMADLLFVADDGSVGGWTMSGTTQTGYSLFLGGGSGWELVTDAEVSGDNKGDLWWRYRDGSIGLWLMDGLAPTTTKVMLNGGTGWEMVAK